MLVADIPGLLEGAHTNYGLGHSFLRHIERCHNLIFVLDGTLDLSKQMKVLSQELDHYDSALPNKVKLLIVNKLDLEGTEKRVRELLSNDVTLPIVPVSGLYRWNIEELKQVLYNLNKSQSKL